MRSTFVVVGWKASVHDIRFFNDAISKYGDKFSYPPPGALIYISCRFICIPLRDCLFAVCQGHTAKAGLHSAKCLPSVTHGKHLTANNGRPIYIILKWFHQNILVMVREQDLQNLLWVQAYVITLTSWTWISFFGSLYSNTQNTSSLIARNLIKQIKSLNIVKL